MTTGFFYEGAGASAVDMHAGVAIAIRQDLIKNAQINKIPACAHRALLGRIKNKFVDVTFVAGYSPGDHLPRNLRAPFWKQLGETVSRLPRRTTVIMGIDANGHVGRDGTGSVGGAGSERWTENGHSLHTFAERCQLTVLNTMPNCSNPGWTWRRSDGKGQGRIDYLLTSSNRTNMISSNTGAVSWVELESEGSPTDHRPVAATVTIRLLDECRNHNTSSLKGTGMTQYNRILSQAFSAYHVDHCNQYTLKKKDVNPEHLEIAKNMLESFKTDVESTWNAGDTVDDKVSKPGCCRHQCLQFVL